MIYSRVSPKAGAEPEEEEEAVALSKAGQEREDEVDGENVDQTLPPAHLVTQTPPHQRPHHHGYVHQQTCRNTETHTALSTSCRVQSSVMSLRTIALTPTRGLSSPLFEPWLKTQMAPLSPTCSVT